MITDTQVLFWVLGARRGLSAKAMLAAALTDQGRGDLAKLLSRNADHPHDNYDFGGCHSLLNAIPEVADHWNAIAALSTEWSRLAANWLELRALYCEDRHDDLDRQLLVTRRGW